MSSKNAKTIFELLILPPYNKIVFYKVLQLKFQSKNKLPRVSFHMHEF
jgi:hypothetical protein